MKELTKEQAARQAARSKNSTYLKWNKRLQEVIKQLEAAKKVKINKEVQTVLFKQGSIRISSTYIAAKTTNKNGKKVSYSYHKNVSSLRTTYYNVFRTVKTLLKEGK